MSGVALAAPLPQTPRYRSPALGSARARPKRCGTAGWSTAAGAASGAGVAAALAGTKSGAQRRRARPRQPCSAVPWWWERAWALAPEVQEGQPLGVAELAQGVKAAVEEGYFGQPPAEGIPKAVNFRRNQTSAYWSSQRESFDKYGPVFKASLGPAGLILISDPVVIRHIFQSRGRYDKGPLAVVADDIFGKGLITAADRNVWEGRRKVVSQGFHNRWLRGLVEKFVSCTEATFGILDDRGKFKEPVDMESVYLNLTLDVVGSTIFGVDFAAAQRPLGSPQSPVVEAVYRLLKETVIRADRPSNILLKGVPDEFAGVFPEVDSFRSSLRQLDAVLDEAIAEAQAAREEVDVDSLQQRQGSTLLRFLVDLRGQSVECSQLRDDLRTLIIAGHETVASILTWATFELARNPEVLAKVTRELEDVLGGRCPTYEDVRGLPYLRLVITETMRMYPAPPSLFRRALTAHVLPKGGGQTDVPIGRGTLLLLQVAMLHRNPQIYAEPDRFWPERWLEPFSGDLPDWRGYDPSRVTGLYPTELATDYAYIPFAGGEYKCIGDQFAMLEVTTVLAMVLQRYQMIPLQKNLEEIGVDLAATIHTRNGLRMRVERRTA